MPYKDPEHKKKFGNEWARQRRADWLATQRCARCGGTEGLHIFGAKKLGSGVFTGSAERRDRLLAEAEVVCDGCLNRSRELRYQEKLARRRERRQAERPPKAPKTPKEPKAEKPAPKLPPKTYVPVSPSVLESRRTRAEWRAERRANLGYGRGTSDEEET